MFSAVFTALHTTPHHCRYNTDTPTVFTVTDNPLPASYIRNLQVSGFSAPVYNPLTGLATPTYPVFSLITFTGDGYGIRIVPNSASSSGYSCTDTELPGTTLTGVAVVETLSNCHCVSGGPSAPTTPSASSLQSASYTNIVSSTSFTVTTSTPSCGVGIAINTALMQVCDVAQLQVAVYQANGDGSYTQVASTANVVIYSTQAPNGQYLYVPFVDGSVQLNASVNYVVS